MNLAKKTCTTQLAGEALSGGCNLKYFRQFPRGSVRRFVALAITGVFAGFSMPVGVHAGSSVRDFNPAYQEQEAPSVAQASNRTANVSLAAMGQPQAASVTLNAPEARDPAFITIGGGWFDVFDDQQAAEFRAEWRSGQMYWIFKPFAGAMLTSDASFYGYAGILTDFYFGRRVVVTPSFAIGAYAEGDGKDLGSVLEFRSGIEVGWRFDNRSRLSVMLYHLSNASIDDTNPGTEVVSVGYSFPLR